MIYRKKTYTCTVHCALKHTCYLSCLLKFLENGWTGLPGDCAQLHVEEDRGPGPENVTRRCMGIERLIVRGRTRLLRLAMSMTVHHVSKI